FVGAVGVITDFGEAIFHRPGVDLVKACEGAVFAAVFFFQFGDLASNAFKLGLFRVQFSLLVGEVAGDDVWLGQKVAGPALVLDLALLVGFHSTPRQRHPAVGNDQVGVVLHGFGPVVHQVLVNVVGIEQRRGVE